ncbi:HNH endonuclease [Lactobacillus crispatus]
MQKKRGRGMQLKKCRYSTCNQLIPFDQKNPFCKKHGKNWHQRKFNYQKTNYKNYNKYQRDPVANAFYHSAPWRRLSVDLRRKSMWTCECCGHTYDAKSFLVVDHIIPFKVEPRLKLDRKNLWVLCKKCHFWKTKLEQQIYGASLIANLDTSKAWPRKKIQNWILTREKSK